MIFHIQLWAKVLAKLMGPYYLVGVLLRVLLPNANRNAISILAAVVTMTADDRLHIFGNWCSLSRALNDVVIRTSGQGYDDGLLFLILIPSVIGSFLGTLLFPWLLARGGVGTVDMIRGKRKAQHATGN